MKNPWLKLPNNKPYILPEDLEAITNFNLTADREHGFVIETLPEPFVGDVNNAKIVLLQLNPGAEMSPGIEESNELLHEKFFPELITDTYKNLRQEKLDYPFYYLNPEHRLSGGFRYWAKIFRHFLKSPADYLNLSNKICCIEYFPYRSQKWPRNNHLRSVGQEYNRELVKNAIERKALIIVMRAAAEWLRLVPELKNNYETTKSQRNPVLSRKNLSEDCFRKINEILGEN